MLNLVDSCGWLEYFAGSPRADFYAAAIEDINNLLVPTICILEVFKRIFQQKKVDAALQAAAVMHQGFIVPLTPELALKAAQFGVEMKMPLADSIILATGRSHNAIIFTQDAHFKNIESVRFIGPD